MRVVVGQTLDRSTKSVCTGVDRLKVSQPPKCSQQRCFIVAQNKRKPSVETRAAGVRAEPAAKTISSLSPSPSSIYDPTIADINLTVLGIILGGGAGSRLYPLTKKRAKPAVPLGANYRLIDIPVSNCINSNINQIYCLTQFNSASLNRHLSQAYNSAVGSNSAKGFVEVLAASQTPAGKKWFQGTADAVRQYLWLFEDAMREGVEDFLILAGDHLYRQNYKDFVRKHRESGADITVAALPCDEKRGTAFGLMKIDNTGRIIEFAEKPKGELLQSMRVDTTVLGLDAVRAKELPFIASMGIYVAKASAIRDLLLEHFPNANDFGSEIIPGAQTMGMHIQAYLYDGYWEDIGTIEAFYNANLALTDSPKPQFSFYDKAAPIFSMARFLPPSRVIDAEINNTVLGDGCVIRAGSTIDHSVIGLRALIGENCVVKDSLLMGADYYETMEECALVPGCLPMGLGNNVHISRAIVDKNARIGPNSRLLNLAGVQESNRESEGFIIKDGIIVVIKDTVIPANTIV